eukprot:scaffold28756_cov39-Attheya_sp.AAC.1
MRHGKQNMRERASWWCQGGNVPLNTRLWWPSVWAQPTRHDFVRVSEILLLVQCLHLGVFVAAMAAYLSAANYWEAKHNVSCERDGGPAYTSVGSADEFIVMASMGLLVLFFLKIYNSAKIIPLYSGECIYMAGPNIHPKTICTLQCLDIGRLNDIDILAIFGIQFGVSVDHCGVCCGAP